ncbi:MAG: hypothetical protein P1Q69_17310, partial [Candidatus Thorarchaeota archaeon]|nr:hypothetical protein [Candidatus Thorarchaeota archaeon]
EKRRIAGIMKVCVVQNVSMTKHLALSTYLRNLIEALAGTGKIHVTAMVSEGYLSNVQKKHRGYGLWYRFVQPFGKSQIHLLGIRSIMEIR